MKCFTYLPVKEYIWLSLEFLWTDPLTTSNGIASSPQYCRGICTTSYCWGRSHQYWTEYLLHWSIKANKQTASPYYLRDPSKVLKIPCSKGIIPLHCGWNSSKMFYVPKLKCADRILCNAQDTYSTVYWASSTVLNRLSTAETFLNFAFYVIVNLETWLVNIHSLFKALLSFQSNKNFLSLMVRHSVWCHVVMEKEPMVDIFYPSNNMEKIFRRKSYVVNCIFDSLSW